MELSAFSEMKKPAATGGGLQRKKSVIESKMDKSEYDILISQITAETKEMWITNLFVDKPCIPICSCYLLLVICVFIAGIGNMMNPALGGGRDMNIWTDPVQVDFDIFTLAREDVTESS